MSVVLCYFALFPLIILSPRSPLYNAVLMVSGEFLRSPVPPKHLEWCFFGGGGGGHRHNCLWLQPTKGGLVISPNNTETLSCKYFHFVDGSVNISLANLPILFPRCFVTLKLLIQHRLYCFASVRFVFFLILAAIPPGCDAVIRMLLSLIRWSLSDCPIELSKSLSSLLLKTWYVNTNL